MPTHIMSSDAKASKTVECITKGTRMPATMPFAVEPTNACMDERSAFALQERILSMLDLNNQFYPGPPISLAMGVASCRSGDMVEAAIHRADQAMYAEKIRYYQEKGVDRRQLS